VSRYLAVWLALTLIACAVIFARARISLGPMPDQASQAWALAFLKAAARGQPRPDPPATARSYRAAGPILVSAYDRGKMLARYAGGTDLVATLERAVTQIQGVPKRTIWRVLVTRGEGPLLSSVPGLSVFSLVPLRDGLVARTGDPKAPRTAYLTSDDLMEREVYDEAIHPPIPDLTFGTDLEPLFGELADALELAPATLRTHAKVSRVAFSALEAKPDPEHFTREDLLNAARLHAQFILRHQDEEGRFTYVYDARQDRERPGSGYSLARHAGTAFFLARASRDLQMPEARAGTQRALQFLRDQALTTCGAPERACALWREHVEFGASALAALASAEYLQGGEDPEVRELLRGLLGFLRAQQRPDGEFMHEYDREREQPVDIQRMYYSGEAALALLAGYEVVGDPRDNTAAARVMTHLTGAGWSFFGSRYYYGEEHWTCQAVGRAARHMDVSSALDFCLRWAGYQRRLQYLPGQTPWNASGAFGVGPVLLPRVTMAASRVEALVPIYRLLLRRGRQNEPLRQMLERSVGLLLRMRWDEKDAHLFARPAAAMGGMPSTMADLTSRADMVQHAGSALLGWADVLTTPHVMR
jgi:hypothetical protein